MKKGIGTDIIEIERIKEAFSRFGMRFVSRLFTDEEWAYCSRYKDPSPHLAARFAAKEAVIKALGGPRLDLKEIHIMKDKTGKPHVSLPKRIEEELGGGEVIISLSHSRHYATATALYLEDSYNGTS